MIKQKNNRKADRMNIQILSYIADAKGKEVTAKEIANAVRSGAITRTNQWLAKLRKDIDSKLGYTRGYQYKEVSNEITNMPMYVYRYDEN